MDENIKMAVGLLLGIDEDVLKPMARLNLQQAITLLQPAPQSRRERIAAEIDGLIVAWYGDTLDRPYITSLRNIAAILREKE